MTTNSIETRILAEMATILKTLPWVKLVQYEQIYFSAEQVRDNEIPCIQFFDNKATVSHERSMIRPEWSISVELILRPTSEGGAVAQGDLFDKKDDIEALIGQNVNLGIPGVEHLRYDGWETDFTSNPNLICRLDFSVLYRKTYVGVS